MKICKVIFSTNRIPYLTKTLESTKNMVDFGDHEVDGIFIDDYPKDRDDDYIRNLAHSYGYNNVILHDRNVGLSGTWNELYTEHLANKDYDYLFGIMSTLYPYRISQYKYKEETGMNTSEANVMWYLTSRYNLSSAVLKNADGSHMLEHIGNSTQGIRLSEPNEVGYENFKHYDPNKRYCSRTGRELEPHEM